MIKCQCGCGTLLSELDKYGRKRKFISGHNMFNKKLSDPKVRFLNFFTTVPECGCWIWEGFCDDNGYGHFSYKAKCIKAHRASWLIYNGDIPNGMNVLHRCDTPSCVNPNHLFLGTIFDNNKDRAKKNRSAISCGECNGNSKLTNNVVLEIFNDMRPSRKIAKTYNISKTQVLFIKNKKQWGNITNKSSLGAKGG